MSYGENRHFEHLKLPMTWTVMSVVGVVCVVAAIMFLGDKREQVSPDAYRGRAQLDAVSSPLNKVINTPVRAVGNGTNWIDDYLFAVRDNAELRKKVADLEQYRDKYTQLSELNSRYEKLLNLRTEPAVQMVTARSVTVSRGPFNNARLINVGSRDGVFFGNPVITEHGLIGRIAGTSDQVSRVLMVTDVVSHVPVMVMRNEGRAMMNGDGGGYPRLDFIRGKDTVRQGDQIVTSGDGGIFPRGLPVGEARKGPDGVWRVKLYADRSPIDYVKILLFIDFSRLPDTLTLPSPSVTTVLPAPASQLVAGSASATSSAGAATAGANATTKPSTAPGAGTPSSASTTTTGAPKPVVASPATQSGATSQSLTPKPTSSTSSTSAAATPASHSATSSSGGTQ